MAKVCSGPRTKLPRVEIVLLSTLFLLAITCQSTIAKNSRTLTFPNNVVVGRVTSCKLSEHYDSDGQTLYTEKVIAVARGKVEVAENTLVGFNPSPEFYRNLDFVAALPTNAFDKMIVKFRPATDAEDMMFTRSLKCISRLNGIKQLNLNNSDATDENLSDLNNLQQLLWLDVSVTNVDGSFLAKLNRLKQLHTLRLNETSIKEDNLKYLCNFPNLQRLFLNSCYLSDNGVTCLTNYCPKLSNLSLSGNTKITNASVPKLVSLKKLKHLSLNDTSISFAGLKKLSGLGLESLRLSRKEYSQAQENEIKKLFPKITLHWTGLGELSKDTKQLFAPLH